MAVLVVAVLWLIGSPQYLPEYFLKVVPDLNTGTGYAMDIAPVGAVARLLHPASIYGLDVARKQFVHDASTEVFDIRAEAAGK